jgi:flagellar assembly factor FliW
MIVKTELFGDFEYQEEDVLIFVEGIYGFDDLKKYLLITNPEEELPFDFLQSVEDEELYFIVTSPYLFLEDYDFEISDTLVNKLEIDQPEDVIVLSLTTIPEKSEETTINLKAPIIVNKETKKAKQVILEKDYPYKHKLFSQKA